MKKFFRWFFAPVIYLCARDYNSNIPKRLSTIIGHTAIYCVIATYIGTILSMLGVDGFSIGVWLMAYYTNGSAVYNHYVHEQEVILTRLTLF